MDTQSVLWMWIIAIAAAVLLGGPVLVILGMFFAWRLPGIILGAVVLLALRAFGKALDRQDLDSP